MGQTIVVVGLGNIGSQVVPHLARLQTVSRIVLVDPGRYEPKNVETQAITRGEVGRRKTQVQGLRLERIRPSLEVTTVPTPVESVPLGRLRSNAILACVDSRATRQYLNQVARRLGVTLVDAGVLADASLARVSVFGASPACACMECGWDQADYDAVEQVFPCQPDGQAAPPTNAPAHLGALAAAMQVVELESLLTGDTPGPDGSREIVIDAASHRQFVTSFERRQDCRLADHEPWDTRILQRSPEDLTLAQVLAGDPGERTPAGIEVAGSPFVRKLVCLSCGTERPLLRLRRSITASEATCKACRGRMRALGQDVFDRLVAAHWPPAVSERTLASLGLETGDLFRITRAARSRCFELAAVPCDRTGNGGSR